MKKLFKQIGKAIGYFAVYLLSMNIVDLIAGFVWGYMKGAEFKAMGMSSEQRGLPPFDSRQAVC